MGGDQRAVVAALAAARLPVAVVNPRQARDVAKATGPLAQTEARDARALAPVAEAVRPTPRPLPDAPADARRALLARRRPLVTRRTAEQHRLGRAPPRLQTDLQAPLTWLHERLARRDDDLDTTRRASPVWREREGLWRRVPGLGPVWTRPLRLDRPAWGPLTARGWPRWSGSPHEPGSWHAPGPPDELGGDAPLCGPPCEMSTLVAVRDNAVLTVFYARVRAVGKPAKGPSRPACASG